MYSRNTSKKYSRKNTRVIEKIGDLNFKKVQKNCYHIEKKISKILTFSNQKEKEEKNLNLKILAKKIDIFAVYFIY